MPALDPAKQGSITPRYLLKIAKARLAELDALGLDPTSEDYLKRRVEIMDLDRRGAEMLGLDTKPLGPQELKQDAWLSVAHVMATSGARTRLMAAKMVVDRSDPVPREDASEGSKTVVNVTIIREARAGAVNGHQPGATLPALGVAIHRESGGGSGS